MSLGIAMIYGGQAFLATDTRTTLLDENGNNTNIQHDKNKLHKMGLTYFAAMGVEPLTTWVINEIEKLDDFDNQKVVMICRELEQIFKNKLDTEIKDAQWLNDGSVELLSVLWATENPEPEIGSISSFDGYKVKIERMEGRLLAKSAINTDNMLSIIINQFKAEHTSLIHILKDIFVEANAYDNAISSSFNVGFTNTSIKRIYANKLTAGTIDALISIMAPEIYGGYIEGAVLKILEGYSNRIQFNSGVGAGGIQMDAGILTITGAASGGGVTIGNSSLGDTTTIKGSVDFSDAAGIDWGSNYPVARFA